MSDATLAYALPIIIMMVEIIKPISLDDDTKAYLKEITGFQFEYAFSGYNDDGLVGLIDGDGRVQSLYHDMDNDYTIVRYLANKTISSNFRADDSFSKFFKNVDAQKTPQILFTINSDRVAENEQKFETFFDSLTDDLRKNLRGFCESSLGMAEGYAFTEIGLLQFNSGRTCGSFAYHEAAHLLTWKLQAEEASFISEWVQIYDDALKKYEADSSEDPSLWNKYGFVSAYSTTSYIEDISEIVGKVYSDPGWLKERVDDPIYSKKLTLLYEAGYIREDSYQYITGASDEKPLLLSNHCEKKS